MSRKVVVTGRTMGVIDALVPTPLLDITTNEPVFIPAGAAIASIEVFPDAGLVVDTPIILGNDDVPDKYITEEDGLDGVHPFKKNLLISRGEVEDETIIVTCGALSAGIIIFQIMYHII